MSIRIPAASTNASASDVLFDALGQEILAEKAAALGRAGERAALCLAKLRAHDADHTGDSDKQDPLRRRLLQEAAEAVHAWFIQRELCGLRRHEPVIRDLGIPAEVLVRLGAK